MAQYLIQEETLKSIANSIRGKSGATGDLSVDEMVDVVDNISAKDLIPELDNEGAAGDLMSGKELVGSDGEVVVGTFSIDNELNAQDGLIAQIQSALQGKASGGSGGGISGDTYTVKNNLSCDVQIGWTSIPSGTSVQLPLAGSLQWAAILVRDANITLSVSIDTGATIMCFRDFESKWELKAGATANLSSMFTVWVIGCKVVTGATLELNPA